MDLLIIASTMIWCVFAVTVACIITLASALYDDLSSRIRLKRSKSIVAKIVGISVSDPNSNEKSHRCSADRGYDSPELFREDLWIRRIEHSRKEYAALAASMPQLQTSPAARADYEKRLCAMLAQARGASQAQEFSQGDW
jgi:hypothetical protein